MTFFERVLGGTMDMLDMIILSFVTVLVFALGYIIWSYVKGLKGSPRELYLLFFTKVTEYSAYGGMNLAFILYLSKDGGLGDISAGAFIGYFSVILTVFTMLVGSVCDTIGVKKTLLIGNITLLIGRFFLPQLDDVWLAAALGFFPMAIGIAVTGPVLSVGIKRLTTKETSALGFGLFYTLMNVGWAVGAWIFDFVRTSIGEHTIVTIKSTIIPALETDMSTYQVIFAIGFLLTIPDFFAILFMRDGAKVDESGKVIFEPVGEGINKGKTFLHTLVNAVKETGKATALKFRTVFTEKAFFIFLGMIGILVFVRLTFYHFHYTFPPYAIRTLGEGLKIGSIYGVLNPVMVVFFTPLFAALTKKISSYKMLAIGTLLSAASVFIAVIPGEIFAPLMDTWVAELIYNRWLEIPKEIWQPHLIGLVIFVIIFTLGEVIWSPRLMQFVAHIAPKGKEGAYISLSYLPYFGAKLFVGPLSGWLVSEYTPLDEAGNVLSSYPNHYMVWLWIGSMAMLTPIGLFIFRKRYIQAEITA